MGDAPRFRLGRELGLGLTGRVFQATLLEPFGDLPRGASVAVKYLRPELEEDPRARRAFESEAQAGLSVRHPGIVRVLHQGHDARGRHLVMPFVAGETLREVRARQSGPLPEPLVRTVARDVAGGLAALHAQHSVHGDVKPDNIRLDAEGGAVLLDLGFARRSGDGAREVAPRPGSLPYIAPEQARGESGDVPSDVFALGVVLYELATGIHPFSTSGGRSADAPGSSGIVARAALQLPAADSLLAAIATARFVPPSRLVPQLSPFFDRAVEGMLARDPARRPDAAEVERRFAEQEAGAWWRGEIGFEPSARRSAPDEAEARQRTPLAGREREMEQLLAAYHAVMRGPEEGRGGAAVWILGPPGSGKSRLVNELAARARTSASPPLYLHGRCRELEEERPCGPFVRMLERYLHLTPGLEPGEREREELETLVPPRMAEALVGALAPSAAPGTASSVPLALATWLVALGTRTGAIVHVDDLSWAGTGTLAVLGHVAELMQGRRLLLVLGLRDDQPVREPAALAAVRARLSSQVAASELRLEPLDEEAVLAIVRALFHHSVPRLRLARVLWQRSRGNPGLIVEILRGLVARGEAVPHDADGTHEGDAALDLVVAPDALPLPGSLRKAIAESYRAMPARDRAWLRRLAVVGGRIEADFLTAAFPGHSRGKIDEVLLRLERSGWLAPAGARWRFARPALREAVYRSLSKEQRVKLHAAAAAALRSRTGAGAEPTLEDAFQHAFHLRSAEDHAGLLAVLPPLLKRLLSGGQPQRVHSLSQWGREAVAALPRSKERDRLRIELLEAAADAADRLGMRAGQRAVLDQLTDLDFDPDADPESVGRVYLLHGRYAVSTGQYGLARGMLRNAELLFARAGSAHLRSEALRRLSLVQSHVGELIEARTLAQAALASSGTSAQRALAHLALGVIDVLEDRFEQALQNADDALSILRAERDTALPGILAAAHVLRARVHRSSGSPARALASASRAVQLARSAGERRLEAEAMARLGGLLLDVDRPEESEARLREALLLATEIEDRRGQALARLFLGILLWENADPEASSMLERTFELAVEMGLNRVEALAGAIRARLFREQGDLRSALEWSARALALVDRFGAELADRIAITGTRALVLAAAGEPEEAAALEAQLRERLERESARIGSPLLRMRHKRASERLLDAVLSADGPVYPRLAPRDPGVEA